MTVCLECGGVSAVGGKRLRSSAMNAATMCSRLSECATKCIIALIANEIVNLYVVSFASCALNVFFMCLEQICVCRMVVIGMSCPQAQKSTQFLVTHNNSYSLVIYEMRMCRV